MDLDISAIIPVYNEEGNLPALYQSLTLSLKKLDKNYEVIFIDDGCTDNSFKILEEFQSKDNRLKIIKFDGNYGQHPAIAAGFEHAKGEIIIVLDADLQNDPNDIPKFIDKIESGYEMVWGWRQNRRDPFITRKIPSYIFNKIIFLATGVKLKDFNCGIKAFRKKLLSKINDYGERRSFLHVFLPTVTKSLAEIPVNHLERKHGESKYRFFNSAEIIFSFLTSYSVKMFRLVGIMGMLSTLVGVPCSGLYIMSFYLFGFHQPQLATLLAMMVLIGVQFFIIGMIGELINRIYTTSHNQPLFVVEKILGE